MFPLFFKIHIFIKLPVLAVSSVVLCSPFFSSVESINSGGVGLIKCKIEQLYNWMSN
jgi:hypothetical protein